ncbi:MAG: hypothetical protein A3K19_27150 [Lentisphaerae bacterium RIFOXYB12_FULL_65_16]|nr:MAG: hypothetical protein A3K18_11780 [Lentisphaerae bacterium RIFOXYA12_64_32]OGV90123.1 MAG: hypothetical protein A3K19_27150 [Lentisphaerae bacterium RIFOXYB12_FULL_65_16]
MHYYGFRFLNTEMGRWINRDPMGERAGASLFGFASNNPPNEMDILGLVDTDDVWPKLATDLTVTLYKYYPNLPQKNMPGSGLTFINGSWSLEKQKASVEDMVKCTCHSRARSDEEAIIAHRFGLCCTISVRMAAAVNTKPDPRQTLRETIEGAYGHEQRHAVNFLNYIFRTMVPAIEKAEKDRACCPPEAEIRKFEQRMVGGFRDQIEKEYWHRNPPPAAYTPYPILGGTTGAAYGLDEPPVDWPWPAR